MKRYMLFVDESGTSHPNNYATSPYYILVGCILEEEARTELKTLADQVKFKYWGKTNIVFHSAEIARNEGDFSIFQNQPNLKTEFYKDLFMLLNRAKFTLTLCIIDKQKAHKKGWDEKTLVRITAKSVMGGFLAKVVANNPSNGKMIFESSNGFKDTEYLAAFNYYLSPNFPKHDPDFQNVRNHITSINFVTKQNHDIETQIADLFGYAARCKQERDCGSKTFSRNSYEGKLILTMEAKLVKAAATMGTEKKKFYAKIKSFDLIA